MNKEEVFKELVRVLRSNGYNDMVLVIRSGDMFYRFLPITDIAFNGKEKMTAITITGKKESVRYRDVVRIESYESLGDESNV